MQRPPRPCIPRSVLALALLAAPTSAAASGFPHCPERLELTDAEGGFSAVQVAFHATRDEMLVVGGDHDPVQWREIFAQRFSSASGAALEPRRQISDLGQDDTGQTFGSALYGALHNPVDDEYAIFYGGQDGEVDAPQDVLYLQRLDGTTGEPVGAFEAPVITQPSDYRLVQVIHNPLHDRYLLLWASWATAYDTRLFVSEIPGGADPDPGVVPTPITELTSNAFFNVPAPLWHPTRDEYVVLWTGGSAPEPGDVEVHLQRLDGDSLAEIGTDDQRVTTFGAVDGFGIYDVGRPSIALDPASDEYLVIYPGDAGGNSRYEVYGQRLRASDATPVGETGFQISDVDSTPGPAYGGSRAKLFHETRGGGRFVVAWDETYKLTSKVQRLAPVTMEPIGAPFSADRYPYAYIFHDARRGRLLELEQRQAQQPIEGCELAPAVFSDDFESADLTRWAP